MKYIVATITEDYWIKAKPWLDSLHAHLNWELLLFTVDFKIDGGIFCKRDHIPTYQANWCENRKDYVCMEGGEFLLFYDFQSDDIILCMDVDILVQRIFTKDEIKFIKNLNGTDLALAPDGYPPKDLYDDDYITTPALRAIYPSQQSDYPVYNCGVILGKVSAWELLWNQYKIAYPIARRCCSHHAVGQWIINYLLQNENRLINLPAGFHEAPWWNGSRLQKKDGQYWIGNNLVSLLHHKFQDLS